MKMEEIEKYLGKEWLDEYWPYFSYVVNETKRAFEDGFEKWNIDFVVGEWKFCGSVYRKNWWVYIHSKEKVVKIEDGNVECVGF